jgi:hypothetical protein
MSALVAIVGCVVLTAVAVAFAVGFLVGHDAARGTEKTWKDVSDKIHASRSRNR